MENNDPIRKISHGSVEIRLENETGRFKQSLIHATSDFGVLLTMNWKETYALLKVCEYVFDNPEKFEKEYLLPWLWANTKFHFMAPLADRKELFWFSYGPLNCYVPTERMREVFSDLKAAFELLGGHERFMYEAHN